MHSFPCPLSLLSFRPNLAEAGSRLVCEVQFHTGYVTGNQVTFPSHVLDTDRKRVLDPGFEVQLRFEQGATHEERLAWSKENPIDPSIHRTLLFNDNQQHSDFLRDFGERMCMCMRSGCGGGEVLLLSLTDTQIRRHTDTQTHRHRHTPRPPRCFVPPRCTAMMKGAGSSDRQRVANQPYCFSDDDDDEGKEHSLCSRFCNSVLLF